MVCGVLFDKDQSHVILYEALDFWKKNQIFVFINHLLDGEIWCSFPLKHVAEVFFMLQTAVHCIFWGPEGKESFRVYERGTSLQQLHCKLSECGTGSLGGHCCCFSSGVWHNSCTAMEAGRVTACSRIHTGAWASCLWATSVKQGFSLIPGSTVWSLLLTGGESWLGGPVLSAYAISCYRWWEAELWCSHRWVS